MGEMKGEEGVGDAEINNKLSQIFIMKGSKVKCDGEC